MALKPWWWLAVAAVACAAIGLAWLPPATNAERDTRPRPSPAEIRVLRAERAVLQAARVEALLALRDSVVAWADTVADTGALLVRDTTTRVAMDKAPTIPAELQSGADEAGRTRVRTVLWRTAPTTTKVERLTTQVIGMGPVVVEPSEAGGRYCIVLAGYPARRPGTSPASVRHAVAGCALQSRFGRPGPTVRAWLDAWQWSLTGVPADTVPPPDWGPDGRITRGLFALAGGLEVRYTLSFPALACLGGDRAACTAAILSPSPARRQPQLAAGIRAENGYQVDDDFGAAERVFVADLLAAAGPARFAEFWTSERPLPEAIERATGVPAGEWIHQWARRRIGWAAAEAPAPLPGQAASSAAWIVVAAGLGIMTVRRRQVR
jgi:hypothetical protein